MYNIDLSGKTAVVTGGAQGIGKACAVKLAEAGIAGLTVVDLKVDGPGEETKKELEALGAKVILFAGDVSKPETAQLALKQTFDAFGSVDIIVNNAGIAHLGDIFTTDDETWDRTMAVNLKSVFLFMKYGAMIMKEQKHGVIVNMASIAGITGGNTAPDYGASKGGVIALTKFGAKTLSQYGIRVNAVAPGTIETEMVARGRALLTPEQNEKRMATIPMGRLGTPEEVAQAVLFLASDLSSYVCGDVLTVTGARMI